MHNGDGSFSISTPSANQKPTQTRTPTQAQTQTQNRFLAGLVNLGNTCYLNSVLQALGHCAPFRTFLLSKAHGNSCQCKMPQFCSFCTLERVVHDMVHTPHAVRPFHLTQNLLKLNKNFRLGMQHDAHEFLRSLLDHMLECCLFRTPPKLKDELTEKTPIFQIFGGKLRSRVHCPLCSHNSDTTDIFLDLSLEFPRVPLKTLSEAFRAFFEPEILDRQNAYKCEECKRLVRAKKSLKISQLPNVLCVHLKRFSSNGLKVHGGLAFEKSLDLRQFCVDSYQDMLVSCRYTLDSVIVHHGSSGSEGHYVCFARSGKHWQCFDDASALMSSESDVKQQHAYILIFSRKPQQQQQQPQQLQTNNNFVNHNTNGTIDNHNNHNNNNNNNHNNNHNKEDADHNNHTRHNKRANPNESEDESESAQKRQKKSLNDLDSIAVSKTLRTKLCEAGWHQLVKSHMQELLKTHGNLKVSELCELATKRSRASVPANVLEWLQAEVTKNIKD